MGRFGGSTIEVDEAVLIARAKRDRAAFAPLYERYANPIFQYCYRCLGNRDDAEDATSLVFHKALDKLGRFDGETLRPWLFKIAVNVVHDHFRERVTLLPLDAAFALRDSEPGPEAAALRAEQQRTLQDHLRALTPEQRQVVELKLAGLNGAEIAKAIDRPHDAVRAQLSRATKRLRTLFGIAPGSTEDGDA